MARIDMTFLLTFHQANRIRKVQSVAIYQEVVITGLFVHILFKILKFFKNMKLKRICSSPHLNCLSPHVANGYKVGQRCARHLKIINVINLTFCFVLMLWVPTSLLLFCFLGQQPKRPNKKTMIVLIGTYLRIAPMELFQFILVLYF